MFQRPQFTFSELDFQLDIGSCRSRLGSESEEYFSDDSPGCWSNSLEEFKFNGRDCDFDCQQSAATADQPPTSPVPQMQQLLQPPCPISFLDNLSEVAATKNKLMQILQRQQQEQGQGERGRFQQGRAFRALGLDSGCRGMPSQAQVCVFCRNNQETPAVYGSHRLKDDIGQVVCPVLYAYTCPICGANGPMAHTIKYCPLNISGEIESGVINQLKSLRKSVGTRRR